MKSVLIVGCGYVGTALAKLLLNKGYQVYGLRRSISLLPSGVIGISANIDNPEELAQKLPKDVNYIVYAVGADNSELESYQRAYVDGLRNVLSVYVSQLNSSDKKIEKIIFTSSTGVYADRNGEVVTEESAADTKSATSLKIIEAEQLLLNTLQKTNATPCIVRFSGIYGPGRDRLLKIAHEPELICNKEPAIYTNRIHQADCAAVLEFLLESKQGQGVFIASDDVPATRYEILSWLREKLNKAAPVSDKNIKSEIPYGSKRCSNAKLKALGYKFIYPTFKEGYTQLLEVLKES